MRFEIAARNVLITLRVGSNHHAFRRPHGMKRPFSLSSAPTELWRFLRRFQPYYQCVPSCAEDYKLRTTWNIRVPRNVVDDSGPVADLKITRRYPLTARQRSEWASLSHLASSTALKHN